MRKKGFGSKFDTPVLFSTVLIFAALVFSNGCGGGFDESKSSLADELVQIRTEKNLLEEEMDRTQTENQQLIEQVKILKGLDAKINPDDIYDLKQIKITRYTKLYDKDKDGTNETLIVYVKPLDEYEDEVKAAGTVDIELWSLEDDANDVVLGTWHVGVDELKDMWFSTMMSINYRLSFELGAEAIGLNEPMVVKVKFIDYLSGKVFKEQKIIKP